MIRMSKKVIGAISGSSAALIGGTTVVANVLIKDENTYKPKDVNPLHPQKEYHHYSIVETMASKVKLNDLITTVYSQTGITYIIEQDKFEQKIIGLVQSALSNIKRFSDYANYTIQVHYKINTKSILVDLVWFKSSDTNKYFDQFELQLHTT